MQKWFETTAADFLFALSTDYYYYYYYYLLLPTVTTTTSYQL